MRENGRLAAGLRLVLVVLAGCAGPWGPTPVLPAAAAAEEPVPPAPGSPPAPAPPAVDGILAKGTVSYADGRTPESFWFRLRAEGLPGPLLVIGTAGRFEQRLPSPGTYRVGGFVADGERREDLDGEVTIEEGKDLAFVLADAAEAALVAVDDATGEPLPGARALRIPGMKERGSGLHPVPRPGDSAEVLPDDGKGRITLGIGRGRQQVWVVAEGHAWTVGEADHGTAAPATVRLPPGGRVRIRVAGWDPAAGVRVHLGIEDRGEVVLPSPDDAGVLELEGVPAGTVSFDLRRGSSGTGKPPGPGRVTAVIRPGATTEVALALRPSQRAAPVKVRGTVRLPSSWGGRRTFLHFEGADPDNEDLGAMVDLLPRDAGRPHAFQVPDGLPPGRYRVTVDPQWTTELVVPPEGLDFGIVIPDTDLVEVRLRVVGEEDGKPLPGARVEWHRVVEGETSWSEEHADADPATGEVVIRAPAGRLSLTASAPGRVPSSEWTARAEDGTAIEGDRAFADGEKVTGEFRLARGGRVRVLLRGASPASGRRATIWLRLGTGDRRRRPGSPWGGSRTSAVGRGWQGPEILFDGVPVGTHEVELEDEGGSLQPIAAQEVEVRAGETASVTLEGVRRTSPPGEEAAAEAKPATAEGILRIVDDATGKPVAGARVHWLEPVPGKPGRRTHRPVAGSGTPGEFRFRAPPGRVEFGVEAEGYVTVDGTNPLSDSGIDLREGSPTVKECRMVRGGTVRVAFRCGDRPVVAGRMAVRSVPDSATAGWTRKEIPVDADRAVMGGLPPGTWVLEVKEVAGYEPVPEREFVLRAGETTEVVVEFVRRELEGGAK